MSHVSHSAPEKVELVYRVVGKTHVFSSRGIQGLVHTGSSDRETAFHKVIECLNAHVSSTCGLDARYRCEMTYDEFARHVDTVGDLRGNFLTMRRLDAPLAA